VVLENCFSGCTRLSMIKFESDSHLSRIEKSVFAHCPSLSSIRIPSHLQDLFSDYSGFLGFLPEASPVAQNHD
jgi:hypothetical protein